MLSRNVFGKRFQLVWQPSILFALFLNVAMPDQVIQFVIGPKPEHFLSASNGFTPPQVLIDDEKERFEFKPSACRKDRCKLLD